MKKILILFLMLGCSIAISSPVKSMIGACETKLENASPIPLPDGIVAVEYIESTGTQYINTGISYNSYTDEINCTIEVTENVQYGYAFGCNEYINGRTRFFGVRRYISNNEWQAYCSNGSRRCSLFLDTSYQIVISPQYGYINEYYFDTGYSVNYVFSRPIYILAVNNDGGSTAFKNKARLYHYSHSRNGETILDLIPVRVEDNYGNDFGAMYDLVSGELFLNQGSGDFIIGPDL